MKREKVIKIAIGKALLSITLLIFTSAGISNAQVVFDAGGFGGGNITLPAASPVEQLWEKLEITPFEFGDKLDKIQFEIYLIANNPLSIISPVNRLNEINTILTDWVNIFNTCDVSADSIIPLQGTIHDTLKKMERVEIELGTPIDEIAEILKIREQELELLYFVPRDSDFYKTQVLDYTATISKQIDGWKEVFENSGFAVDVFSDLQEDIAKIQNKLSGPLISAHVPVTYGGILVLPFEDLLKSSDTSLREFFAETYIRNVTEEIPQYIEDLGIALEKAEANPLLFKNFDAPKVFSHLTDIHKNLEGLNKNGFLQIANETMGAFQNLIPLDEQINRLQIQIEAVSSIAQDGNINKIEPSTDLEQELEILKAKRADVYLEFLVKFSSLTERNHEYIQDKTDELQLEKELLSSAPIRNMPSEDAEAIRNAMEEAATKKDFLKSIDGLILQTLRSITEMIGSIISEIIIENDSYYEEKTAIISTTISNLKTIEPYLLYEEAKSINSAIENLKQVQQQLVNFYNNTIQQEANVPQTSQLYTKTYLDVIRTTETSGLERSIERVDQYLDSQLKYMEDELQRNIKQRDSLALLPNNMLPDDREWIEKSIQDLEAKIELLSESITLMKQTIEPQSRTSSLDPAVAPSNNSELPFSLPVPSGVKKAEQIFLNNPESSSPPDNNTPFSLLKDTSLASEPQSRTSGLDTAAAPSNNTVPPSLSGSITLPVINSLIKSVSSNFTEIGPEPGIATLSAGNIETTTYESLSEEERVFVDSMLGVLRTEDPQVIAETIWRALRDSGGNRCFMMDIIMTLPAEGDIGNDPKYQEFMSTIRSLDAKLLQEELSEMPEQIDRLLENEIKEDLGEVRQEVAGTSENLAKLAIEIGEEHPGARVTADGIVVAPIWISKNTGREIISIKIDGKIVNYTISKFKETISHISQALEVSEEVLHKLLGNIIEKGEGVYDVIWITLDNGKTVHYVRRSDTIVYINSTNPAEIAKEIIKKVFIKRPDASSAVVNRIFLFMVIAGLICIGFGVTLAVCIAKAQIKRSEYLPPALRVKKSFQHNYAANWKTR
ncbi:MAG: hypothetical protein P9L98_04675 [Candidatus Kaelpia imicola]|nr:hypothetical protein [Candidatus Kaelpia imicola]